MTVPQLDLDVVRLILDRLFEAFSGPFMDQNECFAEGMRLALVCRAWMRPALNLRYKQVTVKLGDAAFTDFLCRPHVGQRIRKLRIGIEAEVGAADPVSLTRLLSACSNLTSLLLPPVVPALLPLEVAAHSPFAPKLKELFVKIRTLDPLNATAGLGRAFANEMSAALLSVVDPEELSTLDLRRIKASSPLIAWVPNCAALKHLTLDFVAPSELVLALPVLCSLLPRIPLERLTIMGRKIVSTLGEDVLPAQFPLSAVLAALPPSLSSAIIEDVVFQHDPNIPRLARGEPGRSSGMAELPGGRVWRVGTLVDVEM
ncbi:hypothetical protein JCM10213_000369 [Rhodosporidiobolus nylandii]